MVEYPESCSPDVKDLSQKLLRMNPCERLGVREPGYSAIKDHPPFLGLEFSQLWRRDLDLHLAAVTTASEKDDANWVGFEDMRKP